MNLKNLHFIANGNKDSVKETLEMAQAVYISFGDAPVLQTNSPNKFFDGLAAGKLILTNTKGWIKELVESQECGLYASPKELESVYIELISFLKNPEKLSHYQKNARKLAEDRFSLEVNLSHFLALFDTKKP
jgi:glycosyltransferase involved in cell wall biosynthesis